MIHPIRILRHAATLFVSTLAISSSYALTVTEVAIATANSLPAGIVRGPDGGIWFTQEGASKIGRADPTTGSITQEFNLTANSGPTGITTGPTLGNFLWFTEQNGDRIGKISTSGTLTEYSVGIAPGARPNAIADGGNGFLYFTQSGNGKLSRIDPANGAIVEIAEISLSNPGGIVKGPDSKLWITESGGNRISRFDPVTNVLTPFPLPVGMPASPTGITVGPDNFIWFTEPGRDRIGKIDPFNSNTITEYSTGITAGSAPNYIVTGPDNNLWFTTQATGRVGRITTAGTVLEIKSGITSASVLSGIAGDAGTNMLFYASRDANRIGKISGLSLLTPTLRFESGNFEINERCKEATIKVIREGDTSIAVSVNYATSDLTARAGSDYEASSGTLNFGIGETSKTFIVKPKSDDSKEDVEDVRLTLSNPSSGASISSAASVLQIFDLTRVDRGDGSTCDKASRGGCSIGIERGLPDPVLPLLLVGAASYLVVRRVRIIKRYS